MTISNLDIERNRVTTERKQPKDRAGHLRLRAGRRHRSQRPLQVLQAEEPPGLAEGAEQKKEGGRRRQRESGCQFNTHLTILGPFLGAFSLLRPFF